MGNDRRTLVRIAALVLVVAGNLVLLEVLLTGWTYFRTGTLIWTRTIPVHADVPAQKRPSEPEDPVKTKMGLNPYFGDNTLPGVRFRGLWDDRTYLDRITGLSYLPGYYDKLTVNNHGFWSFHDYPYRPAADEYVVGIFGGSVAFHFWLSTLDERSPVLKAFVRATGRKVVFLNFASGGRKQPQSMLQLAYFLSVGQKLDFVLNIDGFNDVYVSWPNVMDYKVDYSMPFAEFANKIQNRFLEQATMLRNESGAIAETRASRDRLAGLEENTRSGIVYQFSARLRKYRQTQLDALENELSKPRADLNYPLKLVPSTASSFDEVVPRIAELWFNASVLMHGMATGAGIPYLHVLQPNQYYSRKLLTEQERTWQVRDASHVPLSAIVPQAYRAFLERSGGFGRLGIAFLDATPVFDRSSETVFIDWCCHVNERGNVLVGQLIEPRMIDLIQHGSQPARRRPRD